MYWSLDFSMHMISLLYMIVIDIEASGTEYEKHSIVSLGAVDFSNPTNRFYEECRIWQGAHIMKDALSINGFTESQITDNNKETENEMVQRFFEWSQHMYDRTLAGQNVSFDRDFLKAAAHRAGFSSDFAHRTIDTHSLCFIHMVLHNQVPPVDMQHKHSALNLDAILIYCGIPEEPRPHNALTGALSHAEVISRLLYSKKLLPEFSSFDIPWVM